MRKRAATTSQKTIRSDVSVIASLLLLGYGVIQNMVVRAIEEAFFSVVPGT